MHNQPSGCLAINPASDQCLGHHRQRNLNALEIREQVRNLAFRPALSAHLRYRFGQHNPPLQVPAKGHRQLPGMRVAYRRPLLSRGLALLAIAPKHLAPPVIAVPRLWNSIWHWI
jgi:hypothetical protein